MKAALTFCLTLISIFMGAQRVQSSSYDLLLQGLLSHSVNEVSVQDLDTMGSVQFADGREVEEYKVSHIKGAAFIGYKNLEEAALGKLDKSRPVVVYCSIGYRSEKIAEKLKEKGFTKVYNLYGGLFEWVNQGRPVYNAEGPTNDIHPYSWIWGQWLSAGNKTTVPSPK